MSEYKENLNKYGLKPVVVGATSAAITMASARNILPNYPKSVKVNGKSYSTSTLNGVASGIGNIGAELFHSQIFPLISHDDKLNDMTSTVVACLVNGITNAAVHYAISPDLFKALGASSLVGIGAVSQLAGEAVYSKIINPMM